MTTRQVSFANSAITITCQGDLSTQIVDFLYRYAPVETAGSTPPHVGYHLRDDDYPGQLTLSCGETLLYRGDSPAVVAELLLGDSCHHLADRSQGGLLLHAAGLTWQGHGLLLPGTSGAGKTTLTARLLRQGFGYLTDELVFVPWGQNSAQGLTRPLNLKRSARPLWEMEYFPLGLDPSWRNSVSPRNWVSKLSLDTSHPHYAGNTEDIILPASDQAFQILSTPHNDLVAPTLFGAALSLDEPTLSLIIFPRYEPGSDPALRPLSRAKAGLALMQCLLNARNLPEHGFAEVTRLARKIPAYHMQYSHFSQLEGQIESLLLQNKG